MRASTALFALLLTVSPVALMPAHAADASVPVPAPALTDAQKAAVEDVVRDLLVNKEPELIIKGAQAAQAKEAADQAAKAKSAVADNKAKIFNNPTDYVGGNLKGDVTVVEFFDYSCGYCKMVAQPVIELLKADKDVRFVYKEYPILGPASVTAAKASLASVKQDKFQKFHDLLLGSKDHLSDDLVFKFAKDAGLDVEKLKKDMEDPSIQKKIDENHELGMKIGASGTPTFVIGDSVYPGALQIEQMKSLVAEARKNLKK